MNGKRKTIDDPRRKPPGGRSGDLPGSTAGRRPLSGLFIALRSDAAATQ